LVGRGWSPASTVRAQVGFGQWSFAVYSVHIPHHGEWKRSKHENLANTVLAHEPMENLIVAGDFNVLTGSTNLDGLAESTGLSNAISEQVVDHIFFRFGQGIRMVRSGSDPGLTAKTPTGRLSDHPYVWANFRRENNSQQIGTPKRG